MEAEIVNDSDDEVLEAVLGDDVDVENSIFDGSNDVVEGEGCAPREGWGEMFTGSSTISDFTLGPDHDGLPHGPIVTPETPEEDLQNPLWWFRRFWSDDMDDVAVAQTNLYAMQQMVASLQTYSQTRSFQSIDKREFMAFLCTLIALGIPPHGNYTKAFTDRTSLDIIREAISLNRFEQILRYLHFANNAADDKSDPLFKVRILIDTLNKNCKHAWRLSPISAIDEMDVGWRGMHKKKERITYKKAGDGFLVYALCDDGGYVFCFAVKFDPRWKRDIDGLSCTFSAFLHLIDEMRGVFPHYKHGEFYGDNLYSSIPLVESLLNRKIYYCGTLRSNRKPKDFALKKEDEVGTIKQLHKGDMTVMLWRPKPGKEVKMISSIHRPVRETVVQRKKPVFDRDKGHFLYQVVEVTVPDCSADYNKFMNAVDIADQIRSYYTTRRRTRKWWHRFFFFVLDTAICNAYVSYQRYWTVVNEKRSAESETESNVPFRPLTHSQFNEMLAEELLKSSAGRGRKRKRASDGSNTSSSSSSAEKRWTARRNKEKEEKKIPGCAAVRSFLGLHRMEKIDNSGAKSKLYRNCIECTASTNTRKRTVYYCVECNVGLHPECHTTHHLRGTFDKN